MCAPLSLNTVIAPSAPTGTMARLLAVPFTRVRLTLDVAGRVVPLAWTVTNPGEVASIAATFTSTADTPVAGTPPCPRTGTPTELPAANLGRLAGVDQSCRCQRL